VNVLWRGGNRVEWGDAGVLYPARILPASYDLRNILNQGTLRPVLPVSGHPQVATDRPSETAVRGVQWRARGPVHMPKASARRWARPGTLHVVERTNSH
jgi:hypothetical protein